MLLNLSTGTRDNKQDGSNLGNHAVVILYPIWVLLKSQFDELFCFVFSPIIFGGPSALFVFDTLTPERTAYSEVCRLTIWCRYQ